MQAFVPTLMSLLMRHSHLGAAALVVATAIAPLSAQSSAKTDPLAALTPSSVINGFHAQAVYVDAAEKPIGARFVHEKTGFTLDVVRQQSVPQAHIWVNTFPMNDRGEPHTQEHLLVGKGSKGRALGTVESASLATSTAFTEQWRTAYAFNTSAGPRAFYSLFDTEMEALLAPDFTDEEIRREVRNFGISEDPATHALSLEEKGSVYNEMVTSTAGPFSKLYQDLRHLVWGPEHPLARVSGGTPEGIRELRAEDIREFHRRHYYLANMGAIVAVPNAVTLDDLLSNIGRTLAKHDRAPAVKSPVTSMAQLPKPQAGAEGTLRIVGFPHRNAQQPGNILLGWPATRSLYPVEQTLFQLFVETFAGDPTTNLYKVFVDTKTRTLDVGAKGITAFSTDEPGNPLYLGLSNVDAKEITEARVAQVRDAILNELRRVASFADGSPELEEFNARLRNRILSNRRDLSKFVNSPPGFGFRGTFGSWGAQLDVVNRLPGFSKSLVLAPAMRAADSVAASRTNVWRTLLPRWGLTTAIPYAVAAKPDPSIIEREESERKARAAAEVARLKSTYGVSDDQEAIRRYKADYEKNSGELEKLASTLQRTKLVDDLPMTLDDQLQYKTDRVHGVPVVASTFESMTSATIGLALRTEPVRDDELAYLAALPVLMTRVGLVKDGKPLSYEAMSELQRKEILSLSASFSTNVNTGRVELVVRGAGNDQPEATRAISWMRDVLTSADWRPENLSRIRDVVDQTLASLRNTQQGSPESWVNQVASSYRLQDNARYLAAVSMLTRQHYLLRLRWLLKDAGHDADRTRTDRWMQSVAQAASGRSRAELQSLLKAIADTASALPTIEPHRTIISEARALAPSSRALATAFAADLTQGLSDLPDESLASDWSYLVNQLRLDLLVPPATALRRLSDVRDRLLGTGNARAFVISSSRTRQAIAPALSSLIGALRVMPRTEVGSVGDPPRRLIDERLAARTSTTARRFRPTFVSLLDPNMNGGVFLHSVPSATYKDTSRRALTRFLASKLYGGGGGHSVFSQTIAAGLAYSNGIGGSPTSGRLSYYAERTPELPQTLRFVIEQLKKSPHDTALVDYAMALVFSETRSGAPFESRGEGIANDLADGITPDLVRQFRSRVLGLRKSTPTLGKAMYAQMDSVYAELLPGYFPGMPKVPGGVFFTIGAQKQLDAYEKYLKSAVAPEAALFRLYPRDFWVITPTITP